MSELEKLKRGIGCAIGSNLKYTPHENNRNNNANTQSFKRIVRIWKKAENEKLEALVDDRRRDKLDWIDDRMSDTTEEAGRDQDDNLEQ